MAETNTIPAPAADTPATTAPATGAPAPSGAVWDALTATPGGSVAAIAAAAGVARSAARDELTGYEKSGWAARTPGKGRNGDTWTATPPAPAPAHDTPDAPAPEAPADEAPADDEATGDDRPAAGLVMTPEMMQNALVMVAQEGERRAAAEKELTAKIEAEEERRAKVDAELAKAQATEATRHALADLLEAVTATYAALVSGDERATTIGLERVFFRSEVVRRATGAARPTSRTTRTGGNGGVAGVVKAAPRPLRPAVEAHLKAHPDTDFTPGEIGKVLDRSSGAVHNALDKLVELGQAVMTGTKPTRYRLATPDASATPDATTGTSADGPDSVPDAPVEASPEVVTDDADAA